MFSNKQSTAGVQTSALDLRVESLCGVSPPVSADRQAASIVGEDPEATTTIMALTGEVTTSPVVGMEPPSPASWVGVGVLVALAVFRRLNIHHLTKKADRAE